MSPLAVCPASTLYITLFCSGSALKCYFFLGSLPYPERHPIISEQPCWQSNAWMSTPTVWEEKKVMSFIPWKGWFVAGFSVLLSALQQWHAFRHNSSFIKHDTFGVTVTVRQEKEEMQLHMSRVPLYAGAKPIIHVEICLGKLGSTLENKQPETGELHWCFRATLMCCRLMEALPRTQTYC